jgi:hypothetical protein
MQSPTWRSLRATGSSAGQPQGRALRRSGSGCARGAGRPGLRRCRQGGPACLASDRVHGQGAGWARWQAELESDKGSFPERDFGRADNYIYPVT